MAFDRAFAEDERFGDVAVRLAMRNHGVATSRSRARQPAKLALQGAAGCERPIWRNHAGGTLAELVAQRVVVHLGRQLVNDGARGGELAIGFNCVTLGFRQLTESGICAPEHRSRTRLLIQRTRTLPVRTRGVDRTKGLVQRAALIQCVR